MMMFAAAALAAASGVVLLEMPVGDKPGALFRPDDAGVVAQDIRFHDAGEDLKLMG